MSFNSKTQAVFDLQLKRQPVQVLATDSIYAANGGNGKFTFADDSISSVKSVYILDDSASAFVIYKQSTLTVTATTITVTGLVLDTNDVAFITYETSF